MAQRNSVKYTSAQMILRLVAVAPVVGSSRYTEIFSWSTVLASRGFQVEEAQQNKKIYFATRFSPFFRHLYLVPLKSLLFCFASVWTST